MDALDELEESNINIMKDQSKWELLEVTIDSGACDHVIPRECGTRFELFPTKESLAGRNFSAANNTIIKNHGAREVFGVSDGWVPTEMRFNVADVKRCLASTTKLKEQGYLVVLDDDLGEFMIDKKTGNRIDFINKGGTPIMNLWVRKPEAVVTNMQKQDEEKVEEETTQNTGFLWLGFD